MKPPRLLVIADVGGPSHYHLGDEAMLEANLHKFRQLVPGIAFTVLSRDPAWTSKHYGVESFSIPQMPPVDSPEVASTLWTDWLGEEITKRLRDATGLVVSGGGNLCETWPEKILERAALLKHAQKSDIPTVILGQTLGPSLSPDQRRLLSGPLQRTEWLGVRDESSAALALSLGVSASRVHTQLDDAFFLDPLVVSDERTWELRDQRRPWIVVTLDASFGFAARERSLSLLAGQLDALADYLHAALVFVPHVGGVDAGDALSDVVAGRALAAQLRSKLLLLDLWQPREVRWLIEQAAIVVSTRYHPLVFATAAGVPALGIYVDDYTRTKLRGALAAASLEGWCIPLADAERGAFLLLAAELWYQRSVVADRLARLRAEAWPQELRRWDEICRALRLKRTGQLPSPPRCLAKPLALSNSRPALITNEQWREYEQKGYLRLGRVLNEHELVALQKRLDGIMLGRVRYPTLRIQLDTGGPYEDLLEPMPGLPDATLEYRKVQGLESDPLILELIRRDLFREICAWHYGTHASVSIFRVMMMNKPTGKGKYRPWRQNAGAFWKLDRDPLVTSWIALDPATRTNGCVQVIPGSHRLGLLNKHGSTISPVHADLYCPDDAIESLELGAGEALLLHNWLLHRSDVNHNGTPRRALSVCYMDGRTLNTITGYRFPIVFGEHEDAECALPFLRGLQQENRPLREWAAEAERYAKALEKELAQLRDTVPNSVRRVIGKTMGRFKEELEKIRHTLTGI